MKLVISLIAITALPALAAAFLPEGDYAFTHRIGFMGGYEEESCKVDGGEWDDGICLMNADDSVSVLRNADDFTVRVSTVTTNAHMCDFEGPAKAINDSQLLATAEGERYVEGENGGEGKFEPVTCELTLTFAEGGTVSVSSGPDYSRCSSFCGANASLDIERATKK